VLAVSISRDVYDTRAGGVGRGTRQMDPSLEPKKSRKRNPPNNNFRLDYILT
jgi:hypothetical protein